MAPTIGSIIKAFMMLNFIAIPPCWDWWC